MIQVVKRIPTNGLVTEAELEKVSIELEEIEEFSAVNLKFYKYDVKMETKS
jgi:hypothetical protein